MSSHEYDDIQPKSGRGPITCRNKHRSAMNNDQYLEIYFESNLQRRNLREDGEVDNSQRERQRGGDPMQPQIIVKSGQDVENRQNNQYYNKGQPRSGLQLRSCKNTNAAPQTTKNSTSNVRVRNQANQVGQRTDLHLSHSIKANNMRRARNSFSAMGQQVFSGNQNQNAQNFTSRAAPNDNFDLVRSQTSHQLQMQQQIQSQYGNRGNGDVTDDGRSQNNFNITNFFGILDIFGRKNTHNGDQLQDNNVYSNDYKLMSQKKSICSGDDDLDVASFTQKFENYKDEKLRDQQTLQNEHNIQKKQLKRMADRYKQSKSRQNKLNKINMEDFLASKHSEEKLGMCITQNAEEIEENEMYQTNNNAENITFEGTKTYGNQTDSNRFNIRHSEKKQLFTGSREQVDPSQPTEHPTEERNDESKNMNHLNKQSRMLYDLNDPDQDGDGEEAEMGQGANLDFNSKLMDLKTPNKKFMNNCLLNQKKLRDQAVQGQNERAPVPLIKVNSDGDQSEAINSTRTANKLTLLLQSKSGHRDERDINSNGHYGYNLPPAGPVQDSQNGKQRQMLQTRTAIGRVRGGNQRDASVEGAYKLRNKNNLNGKPLSNLLLVSGNNNNKQRGLSNQRLQANNSRINSPSQNVGDDFIQNSQRIRRISDNYHQHQSVNANIDLNAQYGRKISNGEQRAGDGIFSFIKGMFAVDQSQNYNDDSNKKSNLKFGQRGRTSAETKASSSQSAALEAHKNGLFEGWSPQEAIEKFGQHLTEFEKIELGIYERIYYIGNVRRQNQYSIADKDGFYLTQEGEQLGYRYEIIKVIDQGAFGQVVKCVDHKYPSRPVVAAKLGKNRRFDIDNANVEIRLLKRLKEGNQNDNEGKNCIVQYLDSIKFRQHVVIIFEHLGLNLYKYMKVNKLQKQVFPGDNLRKICYQALQGLKYMRNQGVIHCDLKPENILFTDDQYQTIKIIDFGASCTDCSSGFDYVQSRYYRCPEIVLGNKYDHAVDMWSFGCIVYELFVGTPLFPARDENELLEYFHITIGSMPKELIEDAKKQNKFYRKKQGIFGGYSWEIIRSKESSLGKNLVERAQTVHDLLKNNAPADMIDFIEKCLILDPSVRLTPDIGLNHQWFEGLRC